MNSAAADWIAAMRAGDFALAWEISDRDVAETRHVRPNKHEGPRHLQRIWRGEPLAGQRVLVRCYHGLGDTLQFARFLSPLRAVAGQVVVWCQPELLSLIAGVEGVDRALPLHEGTPDAAFDVDIEIMEIPHAIRASRAEVEMRRPYLGATEGSGSAEPAIGDALSVGLVWDVGGWDWRRAVPPKLLKLLHEPGVQLYSLQAGSTSSAAQEIGAIDLHTPDIALLAARLQRLDMCICPDTMVAHLSAALGRETWIMLHADCDWRWPAVDCPTIWYPTVRLFHQAIPGNWHNVVSDVRLAIREKLGSQDSKREQLARDRKPERAG